MSVDSKLVMTTQKDKKVLEIGSIIENSLNNMLRAERKKKFGELLRPWTKDDDNSSSVNVKVNFSSESFIYNFNYKGEFRQLWLFSQYDGDFSHMTNKPNISLSLGMWGNFEEILKTVQQSLQEKYPKNEFFFDFNDSDEKYHKVKKEKLIEVLHS